VGRRWNIDPVEKEEESPYLCFNGNPILNSDEDGDDAESVNDNDEPDDEFIKYKDGSYKKIGSKGGNQFDIIYHSNLESNCVPCITNPNEKLTTSVFPSYNPAMDEDGNYYHNVRANERIEPGVWATEYHLPNGAAESFDLTDLIPSKGAAKWGLKTLAVVLLKKPTKEFVEKKVAVNVARAFVKTNANSKASKKAQTIYGLQNRATKGIEKVGISSGKLNKKGIPYRATKQVNGKKFGKDKYEALVLDKQRAGKNARLKGLNKEKKHTNANKASINPKLHQRPKPE
jgi:hypothetical protein